MKKIILKSLIGFFIGVTTLVFGYISICYISDQSVYMNEIKELFNIDKLVNQVLVIWFVYYAIVLILNLLDNVNQNITNSKKQDDHIKFVIYIIISFVLISLLLYILTIKSIFSKNIAITNIVLSLIFIIIYYIILLIKNSMISKDVKDINKKINEK